MTTIAGTTDLSDITDAKVSTERFNLGEDLIRAYTTGDCWRLACEINIQSGLPIVAIGPEERYWIHVANRLPDGRILDILGIWDETPFFSYWDWYQPGSLQLIPATLEEIDMVGSEYTYPKITAKVHKHARVVLRRAGVMPKPSSILRHR